MQKGVAATMMKTLKQKARHDGQKHCPLCYEIDGLRQTLRELADR
jgi:predicted GNAT family acetyltransferase